MDIIAWQINAGSSCFECSAKLSKDYEVGMVLFMFKSIFITIKNLNMRIRY